MTLTDMERDHEVVNKLLQLFYIARDNRRSRYDNWVRNYRLVNNRFGSNQASSWMPAPRDSEIYPNLSSFVAWVTDQEMDISFMPAADPNTPMFQFSTMLAEDLGKVMYSTWFNEEYDAQVELTLWDACIYGLGIFKSVWDNALDGGYGNAMLRRIDPWSLYVDPNATSELDMEYCVEVRRMSLDEIERRFPTKSAAVEFASAGGGEQLDEKPSIFGDQSRQAKANPGSIPGSGTSGSYGSKTIPVWGDKQSNRRLYEPLPGYVVYEFWLKQNTEDAPDYYDKIEGADDHPQLAERFVREEWRCVIICNGQILFDEPATELWSHGSHPYERVVFDDIGEFYGVSLVDHLAYPQIYINRLLTALQHNAELTGNPVFVESANSGLNRIGMVNRPGQRLTLNGPQGMNNAPQWLTPPAMPQQVMDLVDFWITRIENTIGLDGTQKGKAPQQRSAEGTMQAVQEAAFVRIRSAQRGLERALRRCIMKLADLIIDNYTEPRYMAIVGPDGKQSSLALAANHFTVPNLQGANLREPLKANLIVRAGSRGPTSRSARIAEGTQLYTLGAADDQYVLELYGVKNIPQLLERLYTKRQQGLLGGGPSQRQKAGRSH